MKRIIALLMAAALAIGLAVCAAEDGSAAQTASAWLDQDGSVVLVTVDLTGGWSVEFARGAAYLYDGAITEGKECVAMLVTLDKEVYDEDLAAAQAEGNAAEAGGGIVYPSYEGWTCLARVEDAAYYLIQAYGDVDVEDICARFVVEPET